MVVYGRAVGAVVSAVGDESVGAVGEVHAGCGGGITKRYPLILCIQTLHGSWPTAEPTALPLYQTALDLPLDFLDGAGRRALEAAPEVGIAKGYGWDRDGAGAAEGLAGNEAGGIADPLAGEEVCKIGGEGEGDGEEEGEGGKHEAGGYRHYIVARLNLQESGSRREQRKGVKSKQKSNRSMNASE